MLVELRVRNLGVIADQTVLLGGGLTALTGETGAGKTLLVDAIALLTGAPADPSLVHPGAGEAVIEGRFLHPGADGEEREAILTRVVPAAGRSRSYIDGRMVPVAQLAVAGRALVDIHGQHAHQSLLSAGHQREALDRAGGVEVGEVAAARSRVRELRAGLAALGGDARERARQLDLLGYQLDEMDRAELGDPGEDAALQREEEDLADSAGLSDAAGAVWEGLAGDDGLIDRLGGLLASTQQQRALEDLRGRLQAAQEELSDVASDARRLAETIEADPQRLAVIGERRRVLTELRRKYGGTLDEVMAYRDRLRAEVEDLRSHDERAAQLESELAAAEAVQGDALRRLRSARLAAAGPLAEAVEAELHRLAMPRAVFRVDVGEDPAEESVTWMLSANPGMPLQPLAKVASGGELARVMLAGRLVLGRSARLPGGGDGEEIGVDGIPAAGPVTLVFDEVDAGIGGEAATAVGRALAALGSEHQVLVVTHLAQVAAQAGAHWVVSKDVAAAGPGQEETTVAVARPVSDDDRVVELARMLSGRPDSDSARRHALELLSGTTPASGGSRGRRRTASHSTRSSPG